MLRRKNNPKLVLKIKRAAFFCFGLVFFLFPGQNYYLIAQNTFKPTNIRQLEFELPPPALYPVNFTGQLPPNLTARSVVVVDKDSSVVMYSKNENLWVLPASTVKIMTALVALDYYRPEEILTVGKIDGFGQKMKLVEGEKITIRNLLYGLLLASANDAALVLAQNYPGGEGAFVRAMNEKAGKLHLENTYFANPTGLDSDEEGKLLSDFSYTTALDLAHLTAWALKNPVFSQIIATEKITVTDVSGKIIHRLFNINELLGKIEGLKGGKTGWTEEAGECLVSYTERNGKGVIIVVLGSQDRFGETIKLVNWAFSNHMWQNFTPSI
ncbi:MAG: D-alanyl-D-alanine carboxypeptidase family protein [Microgenomates group bacterium]